MSRPVLLPLVPLYASGVAVKNALYDRGVLKQKTLAWPVISVGNLSTGGAGKTPFVLALHHLLAGLDWETDVLTRGYRRTGTATELVDPSGSAAHFGDEPLLLARAGLAVYVGADRYRAGLLAEQQAHTAQALHILDDGLQHRELARQVEIVLLLRKDLSDGLLPAGNLRDPLSALRRADIIVLRDEDAALETDVRKLLGPERSPLFWRVQRTLRYKTLEGALTPPPQRAVAFCALARPEDFFHSLRSHGCDPLSEVCFRDHHPYHAGDMKALTAHAYARNAGCFVVTAKDACKLTTDLLKLLTDVAPVIVAELVTTIVNEEKCVAGLISLLLRNTKRA